VSCVRDAEGGGERSEPPALPRLRLRASLRWAKPEAISCERETIPMRLLHFVRNDDKAGITEAIAKPVAARPERATANEIVNDILCRFKNLFE